MTLTYERRGDTVTVKCSIDGKVLAVINEDTGKGWDIAELHVKSCGERERFACNLYYPSCPEPIKVFIRLLNVY